MKVYVGSKFDRAEDVKHVQGVLRLFGHEIVGDWTAHTIEGLSGKELQERLEEYAIADFDAVMEADAFVMLHDEGSRGGFTELGIALGAEKLVAVLHGRTAAPHRAPIFYALPGVHHFESSRALAGWLTFLDTEFAEKSHEEILEASR